jgi:Family of unknown function (DUF5689)/Domain of unknown function (DUF5017)
MKTINFKSVFLIAVSSILLNSCVKDDDYSTPDLQQCTETSLVKTKEVNQIPAFGLVTQNTSNDIIEAYVTSSDISGNFYKAVSFQTLNGSIGFSIPVDASSTFINYEPGRKVLIKLKDLYTDVKDGGIRIGGLYANSTGGAEVGRLSESQFKNAVVRSCTVAKDDNLVRTMTIAAAKNDANLNTLIEFNNVQTSPCDLSTTYYDAQNDLGGATNHLVTDASGNMIIVRISAYSSFASKNIPTGSGKLRGVLTKYGTDYQFMVRSEKDVNLVNPRFALPLVNESFDGGLACWTVQSVLGAQYWQESTTFGNPGACAKMSGFAGTNQANEDWLISPKQNLSTLTAATLTFDTAARYGGNVLQVLISRNYSGSGSPLVAGVTWTPLTATFSSVTGNFVWTPSGNININSFTGPGNSNVYVAFKYTSTTSAAATWELDNVKIF